MREHYHTSIEHILLTGIAAILVIDVFGLLAVQMTRSQNELVARGGRILGAVVPFHG